MSAAPSPWSSQVVADRQAVRQELKLFASDIANGCATIEADVAALKADGLGSDTTLAPLFKQLHQDVKAMQAELLLDNLAEDANVLADESIIVAQKEKILGDTGDPALRRADKVVLIQDQVQLQTDEINGLNSRLQTRKADYTTIFTDLGDITTALQSDVDASGQLGADVTKFVNDRTTILNTLEGDISALMADRTQLKTDLIAEEGSLT